MKKSASYVGVVVILFCMVVMVAWVSAATMEDIVGTWDVYSVTKAKVSKLGSDSSEGPGTIEFGADGGFTYTDFSGYIFRGNFSLSADGKKLTTNLNATGYTEFEDMMADWLEEAAAAEGLFLEGIVFEFDTKGIVISTVKISKKTNAPTKAKISAKGTVSALVTDDEETRPETSKFSFKSTITFLPRP